MALIDDYRTKKGQVRGSPTRKPPMPSPARATPSRGQSKEVMFKVLSYGKSTGSAKNQINYIVNESEHIMEGQRLYDEQGREYSGHEVQQIIDDWELVANADNLSKKAREATAAERNAMDVKDRFRERQTAHMAFSFPADSYMTTHDMKAIVQDAMAKYSDAGHRYVMTPHLNADNPHVHVVMKTKSEYGDKLRLDREGIQEMRERVRAAAKERGYSMEATRKTQRHKDRGKSPFEKTVAGKRANTDRYQGKTNLERQVPQWYARNGYDHEVKRKGLDNPRPPAKAQAVYMAHMPTQAENTMREHFTNYQEPTEARRLFTEMMADNKKTALWYANNRPEIFGDLNTTPPRKITEKRLGLDDEWFKDAKRILDRAIADEAPERLGRRVELSHAIVEDRLGQALRSPDKLDKAVEEANRDFMRDFGRELGKEFPKLADKFKESNKRLREASAARADFGQKVGRKLAADMPELQQVLGSKDKAKELGKIVAQNYPKLAEKFKAPSPDQSFEELGKRLARKMPELADIAHSPDKMRTLGRVVAQEWPQAAQGVRNMDQRMKAARQANKEMGERLGAFVAEKFPELAQIINPHDPKGGQKAIRAEQARMAKELRRDVEKTLDRIAQGLGMTDAREASRVIRQAEQDLMKNMEQRAKAAYGNVNDAVRGKMPQREDAEMFKAFGKQVKDRLQELRGLIVKKGGGAYDKASDGLNKGRETPDNRSAGFRAQDKTAPSQEQLDKSIEKMRGPGRDRSGPGRGR